MALETKFTISEIDVDSALNQAKSKVDKASKQMDASLNVKNVKNGLQQATKGMDAIAKSGNKAAGTLKTLSGGIASLMHPIALVAAGITAVIAGISKMISVAKQRAEALLHSHEYELRKAQEALEKMKSGHAEDRDYMQRLMEINQLEHVDNSTKQEAIRIIDILTSKYGDLGLSIDKTTGKILGMTDAMQRQNDIQNAQEIGATMTALNRQIMVLDDRADVVMPRNPRILSDDLLNVLDNAWDGFWDKVNFRRKPDQYDALNAFGGPTKPGELLESMRNSMALQGSQGMADIKSPIFDQRMQEAYNRYIRYFGTDYASILPQDFQPQYNISEGEMKYVLEIDRLREKSANAIGKEKESYESEITVVEDLLSLYRKIEVAHEMMTLWAENDEEAKKWRDIREEAEKAYSMTQQLHKQVLSAREPAQDLSKLYQAENQKLLGKQDVAMEDRAKSYQRKYKAEEALQNVGASREDLYNQLEVRNTDYEDSILRQTMALEELEKQYEKLTEAYKEYDQYIDEFGKIDDDKAVEYYQAEKEINALKLKRIELEKQITDEQTEQLEVQARMKQYEQEMARERQEKMMDAMKSALNKLWGGVLGDLKETSNALTQRGGYLKNVNTINGLQVNRQILNTVVTSNQLLTQIKQTISNVGRI